MDPEWGKYPFCLLSRDLLPTNFIKMFCLKIDTYVRIALSMKLGLDRKFNSQSLNTAKHQMDKRILPFPTLKVTPVITSAE